EKPRRIENTGIARMTSRPALRTSEGHGYRWITRLHLYQKEFLSPSGLEDSTALSVAGFPPRSAFLIAYSTAEIRITQKNRIETTSAISRCTGLTPERQIRLGNRTISRRVGRSTFLPTKPRNAGSSVR